VGVGGDREVRMRWSVSVKVCVCWGEGGGGEEGRKAGERGERGGAANPCSSGCKKTFPRAKFLVPPEPKKHNLGGVGMVRWACESKVAGQSRGGACARA
jgi:hypothetical protein